MLLKNLIPNCNLEVEISSIEIDSRLVKKGSIFFALKGHNVDGAKFIDSAIKNGAVAVVCGEETNSFVDQLIKVKNPFDILVVALQKFYPNLPENILAVTGTNGKTSVASFIWQLQELLGKKAASIGTLGIKVSSLEIADKLTKFSLTTPDIISLYKNLSIIKESGINDIAIETSSIGLEQKRLAGLKIGLGAFTNFTQDHLDYHGSMEKYFDCKMLLFKEVVKDGGIAVLNSDIAEFKKIKEIADQRKLQVIPYGLKNNSVSFPDEFEVDFQKENLLCALQSVVSYYQLNQNQIDFLVNNLEKITPPEGRMQLVSTLKNGAKIFLDYAHTPDAIKNVLESAGKMSHNRLVILFGCGGDRDKSKRPQMGEIASNLADLIIITDDNPRTESSETIRSEIIALCNPSKTTEIPNRREAIRFAISMLKENDILIIAGKGHEKYQIIGTEKFLFDEESIVRECLPKPLRPQ